MSGAATKPNPNKKADVTRGRAILSRQVRFVILGIALLFMLALLIYMFAFGNKATVHQEDYTSTPGRAFIPPRLPPVVRHSAPAVPPVLPTGTLPSPTQHSAAQLAPMGFGSVVDTSTIQSQVSRTATSTTNEAAHTSADDKNKYDPQANGTTEQQRAKIGRAVIGKPFNMHLLLRRNSMFHCVVEQPINTSVPGPLSCTVADDIMSADGSVVLVEKGAVVNGEVMNTPVDGENLVFIGFDEIITQSGLPIYLDGSGGDTLGTSGVPGTVNEHLWRKLRAALLLTAVQVGGQIAQNETQKSGTTNISMNGSYGNQMAQQALESDLNIRSSLYDPQATVITVTVRQDIPFDSVYRLRARD
ncbi:TrbI/VirB10 family protein [Gluconobacter cerinus]|uniref:TrbI/VirB10 family protein n=1 Tax=Gluconobacter cerinus TaxID=38307 RepID=UPI001B8D24F3|nr:TrbI/VirB10 family protein [Gluconobacter cerinus]MBS0984268.1 TrbI/VirB10 family protein [Gluconobacter cerinus]